jgi:hypothetical protein
MGSSVFLAERVSFVNKMGIKRCHFLFFISWGLRIHSTILNSFIIFCKCVCNLTSSIVGDAAYFMELYTKPKRS